MLALEWSRETRTTDGGAPWIACRPQLFATVAGYLILGETLTPSQFTGGVVALMGVTLVVLGKASPGAGKGKGKGRTTSGGGGGSAASARDKAQQPPSDGGIGGGVPRLLPVRVESKGGRRRGPGGGGAERTRR